MDWVQIDLVSRANMDNIFNNNQSFMVAIQKIFFGKKYLLKKLQFRTISFSCKVWDSCSVSIDQTVNRGTLVRKFVQKCQYYYSLSDQSVPQVTVRSTVSLLTEQL